MTDEQLIEELSFPAYRRTSIVIFVPGDSPDGSAVEMVTIDPRDLSASDLKRWFARARARRNC